MKCSWCGKEEVEEGEIVLCPICAEYYARYKAWQQANKNNVTMLYKEGAKK